MPSHAPLIPPTCPGRTWDIPPLTALRRHDPEAVRKLGPRRWRPARGSASPNGWPWTNGSLAWLAWQDGRPDEVLALAAECDELIKAPPRAGDFRELGAPVACRGHAPGRRPYR